MNLKSVRVEGVERRMGWGVDWGLVNRWGKSFESVGLKSLKAVEASLSFILSS